MYDILYMHDAAEQIHLEMHGVEMLRIVWIFAVAYVISIYGIQAISSYVQMENIECKMKYFNYLIPGRAVNWVF